MKQKLNIFFILCLFLFGCNKDKDNETIEPQVTSQLIISPEELKINDVDTGKIFMSVQPPGEFQWNISAKPEWLDINPSSGVINDETITIELIPKSGDLAVGKHIGDIEIITNGAGKAKAVVQLCVDAHPLLKIEPEEISFAESEEEKRIKITNVGTGFLHWSLENLPDWIDINFFEGSLDTDESIELTATVNRYGLSIGKKEAELNLKSNSEDGDQVINLSMEVPPTGLIGTPINDLNFKFFENEKTIFVKNYGNTAFDWTIENSNAYIQINPSSGNLGVGDSIEVVLTLDRTDLATETLNSKITLKNNFDHSQELPIAINNYKEEKWLISGTVIDAEFDQINDVMVVVSTSPNQLRKFDPITKTIDSVELNLKPSCVAISQDGKYAAVGHNGSFAYVNLTSMTIEKQFTTSANIFDIILAPNNWVYAIPTDGQWVNIRCVELATGNEVLQKGYSIRHRTKVKLHPFGTEVYGANNGLSPSDFEKYDISGDTAKYLYDSPYHGDYSFGGDIWISEDGNRLFAKSRNVFYSDSDKAKDMTYSGELEGEGQVLALDHSKEANLIYTSFTSGSSWNGIGSNEIRIYDATYLGYKGVKQIPDFLIPDGTGGGNYFKSGIYFGFFDGNGTKYHALAKAESGSGAEDDNEWAIVTVDVD